MTVFEIFQIFAACAGIATVALVMLTRRFGQASLFLAFFLVPASLSAGAGALVVLVPGWDIVRAVNLSFSLLILAVPGGVLFGYTAGRVDFWDSLRRKRLSAIAVSSLAPILTALLHTIVQPSSEVPEAFNGLIDFGPIGYLSALYLLITAIIVLANLEQTLRCAQKQTQWEIKFLLLGPALSFGSIIYISTKTLLYPWEQGVVFPVSLRLFPILFPFSCILILISWRRSSAQGGAVVSHGLIYSSITMMAVGAYIITASLLARWAGEKSRLDIPMESVIFLLSLVILAAALLGTTFRQRAKLWIRRHVLAGRYDYRRYWLEVTERIRAIDTPQDLANSLAEIVQKALGAVEVTVWSRLRNPNRLCLLSSRGLHSDGLQQEVRGVVEHLFDLTEPLAVGKDDRNSWPAEVSSFIEQTHASLIVPLVSDGKTVGILAVGSDRSGREFDWEALEFLGVLGRHAAGELHKAELRSTLLEAKELEAFRTFSTFLMHDLKNYASTLSIMAKSSARHSGNPEFQRDSFQAVFEIAGHMKRLCAGLRTFSSGLAADKKLQDLNEITRQAADSLFDGISNRLVLDLGDVPPLWLDADEVSRVLHNLIVNAQEASASGGVITLRTKCLADAVELWVEDNGSGMSREFVQRELFHPFHTTKSDGLGIGLFQTRKIVEAHKGTIQVESEEGKGTKVRVVFPIPPRAPEPQPEIAIKVGQ